MVDIWVTAPGEENGVAKSEVARRLQEELAHIESLEDEAACRLCGKRTLLTKEHAPAKKAGNPARALLVMVDYVRSLARGRLSFKADPVQGATFKTLCTRCNNNTGSWYNPAYLQFVQHCHPLARQENAGKSCNIDIAIHPQRVLKQALASVIATCQPGLCARYPMLREFVIGREARGAIAPVRVWLYLRANSGGRTTGLVVRVHSNGRVGQIVAEFSFYPLGWIVTFDDAPVEGAVEVSKWSEVGFHDKVALKHEVPCQWAYSPFPMDFRPAEAFQ